MANLKFADTHNMVAFLSKPAESEGNLQLEDAEGVDYLSNATIFEQLALIRHEQTIAWNEFSSTMASAIICLATNQMFNLSKYIFESMVKNLENVSGKFLMYPRKPNRKDTQIPQSSSPTEHVADKAVYKKLDDSLVRVATTASSLKVEQDSANEIASLKRRVKKLEKKNKSRTHKLKRLYKVSLSDRVESSGYEESLSEDASKQERRITLVNDQIDVDAEMFDVDTLTSDEVLAEQVVAAKDVNLSVDEVTLAQALAALKS
ncbi:hypothetical protein Tco_1401004, partial [Tanacetum coccineum]